jgi:tetratricopeptide (TPR) repeat protein
MNEVFILRESRQTEAVGRHLDSELPDDPRITEINRLSELVAKAKKSGDLASAIHWEGLALQLCEELGSSDRTPALQALIAAKHYNLGQLYYSDGDSERAKAGFDKALELDVLSNNLVCQAADLRGLAFLKQDSSDTRAAIDLHRRALELDEQAGFLYGVAMDEANLGQNLLLLGKKNDAIDVLRSALERFRALGHSEEAAQVNALLAGDSK